METRNFSATVRIHVSWVRPIFFCIYLTKAKIAIQFLDDEHIFVRRIFS
ncbi:MAG: hypothetical protein LBC63_10005 [Holophagales bacterium]|nr:hypothetical protein [Holophagales bacterium]